MLTLGPVVQYYLSVFITVTYLASSSFKLRDAALGLFLTLFLFSNNTETCSNSDNFHLQIHHTNKGKEDIYIAHISQPKSRPKARQSWHYTGAIL